jgi:hypothetical protein
MDHDDAAYKGQREYTPLFLKIYDPVILGFFAPAVWRCPTTRLVAEYRRHLGRRHLDVGPGTGYFLARAGMPDGSLVTLLDPNVHVLGHASRRLQRLDITTMPLGPVRDRDPRQAAATVTFLPALAPLRLLAGGLMLTQALVRLGFRRRARVVLTGRSGTVRGVTTDLTTQRSDLDPQLPDLDPQRLDHPGLHDHQGSQLPIGGRSRRFGHDRSQT